MINFYSIQHLPGLYYFRKNLYNECCHFLLLSARIFIDMVEDFS